MGKTLRPAALSALLLAAGILTASTVALGASTPRLSINRVDRIALGAAQPYAVPADGSVTVQQTRLGHSGPKLVWLVRVSSGEFHFPCKKFHAEQVSCIPSFLPWQHALVTISDATGGVVAIAPSADVEG
jgi:hypothetical protein